MGTATQVDVRVVAKDGKYLGDDVGGALVTIHDVHTGALLAQGRTHDGSGQANLMKLKLRRSQVLPVDGASVYSASLDLSEPCLVRVTAYGPLGAQGSANTVSQTQWVYPGKDITGGPEGGGFLLEVPGLVVQIMNPPTHFLPQMAPAQLEIRANVTMMCGCPIGKGHPPWNPAQFDVTAVIKPAASGAVELELPLKYDAAAPYAAPSQFIGTWQVSPNETKTPQIYAITVVAFQQRTGNLGVDKATFIMPPAAKTSEG